MRKFLLAAVATLALATPAMAQGPEDHACITDMAVRARAAEQHMPVFYTLRSVDIGFEDRVDITIFEGNDGTYWAMAFDMGCYVAYATYDQMGVEDFINTNIKKADGV